MTFLERFKGLTLPRPSSGWVMERDGFMIPPSGWLSSPRREMAELDFMGMVGDAYKSNGIVFACILARLLPFSEARFQYQRMRGGRPGDLFGDDGLALLERPWPNGTTGELLAHMEQDASLAGNFFATVVGEGQQRRLRRLRPDWVTIISGVRDDPAASPFSLGAEVLGYIYAPKLNGQTSNPDPVLLSVDQVAHFSPIPDPAAQWRGMSWLTPILSEISADSWATRHKLKFFENGTIAPFAITYDADLSPEAFNKFVALFNDQHRGSDNAYKVIHLGGGADPKTVGANWEQLDFKATQGAGETRIAAAAGVGAIIARLSEGMQGSSLNQGNYNSAKRQFADMTLRPLWRIAAGSLEKFARPPDPTARLWYDARDVAFLKEDQKDAAAIALTEAQTIAQLVASGFKPDSVVAAVRAGDFALLVHDPTLISVQVQPNAAPAPTA